METLPDPIDTTKTDEVMYTSGGNGRGRRRGSYQKFRGHNRFQKPNGRYNNYKENSDQTNRLDPKTGKPHLCHLCKSPKHYIRNCPEKKAEVNFSMFVGCASSQADNNLQSLVNESKGYAILDSGCSTTVCGEKWLENFVESLSDEERFKIKIEPSAQNFTFGDGKTVVSKRKVTVPCWMGGKQGEVSTDVVHCNIPLLLSRKSMKSQGMVLDFKNDQVSVMGRDIKLKVTKSGHYALPLSL